MWARIMTTLLVITIPSVVFVTFLLALLGSIKDSAKIPRLQRGDSVVVITAQGTYNLFLYCERDNFLRCTDEEGNVHIFRGTYEIHEKQLPEKLAPLDPVDSSPPHTSETLLR